MSGKYAWRLKLFHIIGSDCIYKKYSDEKFLFDINKNFLAEMKSPYKRIIETQTIKDLEDSGVERQSSLLIESDAKGISSSSEPNNTKSCPLSCILNNIKDFIENYRLVIYNIDEVICFLNLILF